MPDDEQNPTPAGGNGGEGASGGAGAGSVDPAELAQLRSDLAAAQAQLEQIQREQQDVLIQLGEATSARTAAEAQIQEARAAHLDAYRRAVLAENAGNVVAELVAGDTPEAIDASVTTAKAAFERIAEAVRAANPAPVVPPVGAGASQSNPSAAAEGLSPMDKISQGLARQNGRG